MAELNPLQRAVAAYKRQALDELGPERVLDGVRLLKEVNARLPGRDLLTATAADIKAAGVRLFAAGEPRTQSRFLTAELQRFFAAAQAEELVAVNPLTGAARLAVDGATAGDSDGPELVAVTAELVAELIADGIQAGLRMSPIALPVAELGEDEGPLDHLVSLLSARWQGLARRLRPLLATVRVLIPAAGVVLGIMAFFDPSGPFGTGMELSNAMQDLKMNVALLESQELLSVADITTLSELGARLHAPTTNAAKHFDLLRVRLAPPVLYLRYKKTGGLLVMEGGQRGGMNQGVFTVRQR